MAAKLLIFIVNGHYFAKKISFLSANMYINTIKPTKTAGSMDYYRINKFVKFVVKKTTASSGRQPNGQECRV